MRDGHGSRFAFLLAGVLAGCAAWAGTGGATTAAEAPEDSLAFRIVPVLGPASLATLRQRFGSAGYAEILRLNRVDASAVRRLDSLVVPVEAGGFRAPGPLPDRAVALDSLPRALVVALRIQAFGAYERGHLVRWGPICSGGRGSPTRTGLHHVNWRLPTHRSTVDSTWVMPWTVNIDNDEGTALHQFELPGGPASHCCIRLSAADAKWVYDWVETWRLDRTGRKVLEPGTPVILFGDYDFDAPRPWRRLPADPGASRVGGAELDAGLRSALREGVEKKP